MFKEAKKDPVDIGYDRYEMHEERLDNRMKAPQHTRAPRHSGMLQGKESNLTLEVHNEIGKAA